MRRNCRAGGAWPGKAVWFCQRRMWSFAPLVVQAEGSFVAEAGGERVEVVLDKVTVRLDAGTSACRLAEIVSALNASS